MVLVKHTKLSRDLKKRTATQIAHWTAKDKTNKIGERENKNMDSARDKGAPTGHGRRAPTLDAGMAETLTKLEGLNSKDLGKLLYQLRSSRPRVGLLSPQRNRPTG